jgi:citrate lyase beta subunit
MRSFLFVPGDSEKKLEKSLGSGADVLVLDLEDSVAADAKVAARATVAGFLKQTRKVAARPKLYVRVNALDTGLLDGDLDAVLEGAPDGIMLPKCGSGGDATLRRKSCRSTPSIRISVTSTACAPNARKRAATASWPRWQFTRHRCR